MISIDTQLERVIGWVEKATFLGKKTERTEQKAPDQQFTYEQLKLQFDDPLQATQHDWNTFINNK
jgi:hypothetical protein